jgi:hypothetical protein
MTFPSGCGIAFVTEPFALRGLIGSAASEVSDQQNSAKKREILPGKQRRNTSRIVSDPA